MPSVFPLFSNVSSRLRFCSSPRTRVFFVAALAGLTAAMALPSSAWADSVVLKNGDRLTGTVNELAGGKLTLTTSYAGAVAIAWDQVTSVKLDKPLVLPMESKEGKQVTIQKLEITGIDRTDSGFVVTTATGPQPVPAAGLIVLRTAAAEQAYEASVHPNFTHGWTGAANVSVAYTSGNSATTSVGTGVNLARPTRTDKTTLYFNDVYSRDDLHSVTTADSTNAGLRYDHNVTPKLFVFGTMDFAVDGLQELDLRSVAGGGFGWHAIAKPNRQLDVLGGAVWTHENYSSIPPVAPSTTPTPAETNSFGALDFGQQFTEKFGKATTFTEQAYIFPDLADTSQYRFTLNSALSTKINSFLSWQTAVSDVYVTDPPVGTKDNDLVLTTGLGFSFTRK